MTEWVSLLISYTKSWLFQSLFKLLHWHCSLVNAWVPMFQSDLSTLINRFSDSVLTMCLHQNLWPNIFFFSSFTAPTTWNKLPHSLQHSDVRVINILLTRPKNPSFHPLHIPSFWSMNEWCACGYVSEYLLLLVTAVCLNAYILCIIYVSVKR